MLFNSYHFMFFFPLVLLVYFLIPKKLRYLWLLVVSYYFYMSWSPKYAILILFSTVITYLSGVLIVRVENEVEDKEKKVKYKKGSVVFSICLNLAILFFFKYSNFLLDNLNNLFELLHISFRTPRFYFILPVGISFYTFQALSYTIDVYRGDIEAEKNFFRYALFVSFFPQLVAGPIERSKNLLAQVQQVEKIKVWNYRRIVDGTILMVWGYFLKMVVADRVSILVDTVFNDYRSFGSIELGLAAVAFALQIYCDFASYSTIAVGAAKIMGFELMENFNTPYFANSIKDFWRRWHISLSSWFRDYVYIPLGGNRCSCLKKYRNLLATFLLSGLWHGANWTYVVWGGLHGIYQVIGDLLRPLRQKIELRYEVKTNCFSYKLLEVGITFIFVDFAWIFFRANSISQAIGFIGRMVSKWNPWALFDGTIYTLGLDRVEMNILLFSLVLVFLVDLIRYHLEKTINQFVSEQNLWFSWTWFIGMVVIIFIFGMYGPGFDAKQFIYFQF